MGIIIKVYLWHISYISFRYDIYLLYIIPTPIPPVTDIIQDENLMRKHIMPFTFFNVINLRVSWCLFYASKQVVQLPWAPACLVRWCVCFAHIVSQGHTRDLPISPMPCELITEISWKLFCCNYYSNDLLRSEFCTCHGSWAVVACAELWPAVVNIFDVRATNILIRFE